jgi:hypothetical protein
LAKQVVSVTAKSFHNRLLAHPNQLKIAAKSAVVP